MQVRNKLALMVGHYFLFETRQHRVIDWVIDEASDTIYIATDVRIIPVKMDEAQKVLVNDFLPVEAPSGLEITGRNGAKPIVNSLIDELQANIKLVKADPGFIRQASAINGAVAQISNLVKLQMKAERMGEK